MTNSREEVNTACISSTSHGQSQQQPRQSSTPPTGTGSSDTQQQGGAVAQTRTLHDDAARRGDKRCPHCSETKPLEMFSRHAKRADGRQSVCKECEKRYRKSTQRASDLKRNFGLTVEQWDAMLAAQGGGCAICHVTEAEGARLVVDHDQRCCPSQHGRKVARACGSCTRGILCSPCNVRLGIWHEDLTILADKMPGAVEYLAAAAGGLRAAERAA